MDKIQELCKQLIIEGIKPKILLVGREQYKELNDYFKEKIRLPNYYNNGIVDAINLGFCQLTVIPVSMQYFLEVLGNERYK